MHIAEGAQQSQTLVVTSNFESSVFDWHDDICRFTGVLNVPEMVP
jgi:hypothetical protein